MPLGIGDHIFNMLGENQPSFAKITTVLQKLPLKWYWTIKVTVYNS